jgi:hypothetical protein
MASEKSNNRRRDARVSRHAILKMKFMNDQPTKYTK